MKYCEAILHDLSFNLENITPCGNCFSQNAPKYLNIEQENQYKEFIDFENTKEQIIFLLNQNFEEYSCKHCMHLKDDETLDIEKVKNSKYNSIFLRYWTTCNSYCVYCDNIRNKTYGNHPKYNPYLLIKNAYEKNLIDSKKLIIRFHGGDVSVNEHFQDLMNLFNKYGFDKIHFSTNNIIYQPEIEKILKQGKGTLNLSLDCGTQKTYERIKRVARYNNVINNLKRYVEIAKDKNLISVHYILTTGYNDNKKEIQKFLKLMKEIGITNIGIRIDHKDLDIYLQDRTKIFAIKKYEKLVKYFYNLANKYSFIFDNDSCIEQNFAFANTKNNKRNILSKIKSFLFKTETK